MDLKPAVDLAFVHVGHDLTTLIEQRDDRLVADGITHRVRWLHEIAEFGEGALFLLRNRCACEGDKARVGKHLAHPRVKTLKVPVLAAMALVDQDENL
jgi:hypothetical protein